MSDMKGSEANPAGYVLIGKAGLSRPLGIKPVRSRSLNISLVPYYLKRRTRPITSDVAPSLSQERINTWATLREYPSVIRQFSSGDIKKKICLS